MCFGSSSKANPDPFKRFSDNICIICVHSRQVGESRPGKPLRDPPFQYLGPKIVAIYHRLASEALEGAIEMPQCTIGTPGKKQVMCDVHQMMHNEWLYRTGRTRRDLNAMAVDLTQAGWREVVTENREHVEAMMARRGAIALELFGPG